LRLERGMGGVSHRKGKAGIRKVKKEKGYNMLKGSQKTLALRKKKGTGRRETSGEGVAFSLFRPYEKKGTYIRSFFSIPWKEGVTG